jgi:DNA-directed RNA polymerase subunit RPC12/RpoP
MTKKIPAKASRETRTPRETREVTCPRCQKSLQTVAATVITPESAELAALLKGTLNSVVCDNCGCRILLDTVMMYRDDAKRLVIWCIPADDAESWQEAEQAMQQMSAKIFAELPGELLPECRLTISRRGFIEKIMIFQNGLDDRLVEFIKYQLYQHPKHPIDANKFELLYDFTGTDSDKLMFVSIERATGRAAANTHLEMVAYQEMAEIYANTPDGREEMKKIFPDYLVSADRLNMD